MEMNLRIKYLRIALVIIGLLLIFGVYLLMILWPSGWRWLPHNTHYEQMIVGIYLTLGIFLILAAKDPLKNLSLIWFTVWSSIVHAAIMLVQALFSEHELGHLVGDVPALLIIAIVLSVLTPRASSMK